VIAGVSKLLNNKKCMGKINVSASLKIYCSILLQNMVWQCCYIRAG
jgi:hypothetical protein